MHDNFPLLEASNPKDCQARLIMICNRIIESVYRKHIGHFELSNSQFTILMLLAKMGKMNQTRLAGLIFLEKSSLSRNLKRLIDNKYMNKDINRQLQVTIKGKAILESMVPAWERARIEVQELLGDDGQNALSLITSKLKQI